MSQSFLFQLREAAKRCPNVLTCKMLRDSADEIHFLMGRAGEMPSLANFAELNGAIAKAVRTLSFAEDDPAPDNSRGGAMPLPERLAA